MEQNKEPRSRPTQIQSIDLSHKSKGQTMEQSSSLQQMVLEQLDINKRNNDSNHRPYTVHKN